MRWLLLLAVVAALALRCPQLAIRPMHNDEAVNAIKLRGLWEHGTFKYDPHEYHGPSLYYASWLWLKIIRAPDFSQWTETQLRLVTVIFGTALILLLPLLADGLGRASIVYAAIFIAISPAMVFYSRYYIHEMLLVFFSLLTLAAGWRYRQTGKLAWAVTAGLALGLMYATKETFVLTLAAAFIALIIVALLNRFTHQANTTLFKPSLKHLALAFVAALAIGLILFSSFFTNAQGPLDSLRTYLPNLHRAGGDSPHLHPWYFYLQRLAWFHSRKGPVWTEAFILLLALGGIITAFRRRALPDGNSSLARFIALYTIILTAIYSVISYKTSWCLLNFWLGAILLAGLGTTALLNSLPKRPLKFATAFLLSCAAIQLVFQTGRTDTEYAADTRNPYIYAQTSPDILQMMSRINGIANVQKTPLIVKVMAPDSEYWPLPWYLRRFDNVGYWPQIPADPFAPIMIVSAQFHAELDQKKTHLMVGLFELRPQTFFELYVEADVWRNYVEIARPGRDE